MLPYLPNVITELQAAIVLVVTALATHVQQT